MVRKVTVAIFDNDLKATLGKYELSDTGMKIRIKSGGEANWNPSFDNDSFIEIPRGKFEFWKRKYTRIYFVKKKGKKCVNFKTGIVSGPDPEQLKEAIGAIAFKNLGKDDNQPTWITYATLAISFFVLLIVSGVLR